jgi:Flp pilus assembly pilin Flp
MNNPMNNPMNIQLKRMQFGQSMVEYLVLASLIGIALALGKPSILEQLINALQTAYQGFAMAMSMP